MKDFSIEFFVAQKHAGQFRHSGMEPYVNHLKRVALAVALIPNNSHDAIRVVVDVDNFELANIVLLALQHLLGENVNP